VQVDQGWDPGPLEALVVGERLRGIHALHAVLRGGTLQALPLSSTVRPRAVGQGQHRLSLRLQVVEGQHGGDAAAALRAAHAAGSRR
jgi:hypothetical protein